MTLQSLCNNSSALSNIALSCFEYAGALRTCKDITGLEEEICCVADNSHTLSGAEFNLPGYDG